MHFNIWHESRLKPTNYKRAQIGVLTISTISRTKQRNEKKKREYFKLPITNEFANKF